MERHIKILYTKTYSTEVREERQTKYNTHAVADVEGRYNTV
jgi:hypothetical protein